MFQKLYKKIFFIRSDAASEEVSSALDAAIEGGVRQDQASEHSDDEGAEDEVVAAVRYFSFLFKIVLLNHICV